MKSIRNYLIIFLFLGGILLLKPSYLIADQKSDLENKIQEYETKLNQLKSEKDTLSSQIEYMKTQEYITTLQIEETEEKIVKAEKEIKVLGTRISSLDSSLDQLSKSLIDRITASYKNRKASLIDIIIDSTNASMLTNRLKYYQIARAQNQKALMQVMGAKTNFEEQKDLRERKIEELDSLKLSLDVQQDSLIAQQAAKANLLTVTKNDENTYQQLLESARAELNTIQQAVKYLQQSGEAVPVSKGDFIGVQGSTGHSTGDHLHFGVYNYSSIADLVGNWYYNNWEDPGNVLPSRQVEWSSGCGNDGTKTVGNGSIDWEWPISNLKYITQGAGHTCYSDVYYKGNAHPAWDMAGPLNTSIYAVDSGNAYYCRNCLGDGGNGVFVFHPNGKMTMYWHVK